jgi:hypothetical protein
MNPFYIKRAEYVEVAIPTGNTNTTIYFPDLPNLRTSRIFGIEAYDVNLQGKTITGATVQANAEIVDSVVSLYFDGGYFIQVPTISLLRQDNANYFGQIPMLAGQVIVWAKSYITLTGTIANYATKSFLFSVYYSKNNI